MLHLSGCRGSRTHNQRIKSPLHFHCARHPKPRLCRDGTCRSQFLRCRLFGFQSRGESYSPRCRSPDSNRVVPGTTVLQTASVTLPSTPANVPAHSPAALLTTLLHHLHRSTLLNSPGADDRIRTGYLMLGKHACNHVHLIRVQSPRRESNSHSWFTKPVSCR